MAANRHHTADGLCRATPAHNRFRNAAWSRKTYGKGRCSDGCVTGYAHWYKRVCLPLHTPLPSARGTSSEFLGARKLGTPLTGGSDGCSSGRDADKGPLVHHFDAKRLPSTPCTSCTDTTVLCTSHCILSSSRMVGFGPLCVAPVLLDQICTGNALTSLRLPLLLPSMLFRRPWQPQETRLTTTTPPPRLQVRHSPHHSPLLFQSKTRHRLLISSSPPAAQPRQPSSSLSTPLVVSVCISLCLCLSVLDLARPGVYSKAPLLCSLDQSCHCYCSIFPAASFERPGKELLAAISAAPDWLAPLTQGLVLDFSSMLS